MKLLSIQVGKPIEIEFRGRTITTGIFKDPIKGPVLVRTLNIEGDGQADLRVHGGVNKAVYAYSFEAYDWWKKNRPDNYTYGAFGENLTFDNLQEKQIFLDDVYQLGEAVLQVSEPRFPCSKLVAKFNDPQMIKIFNSSERSGVYFRVLKEGMIDVGGELKLISRVDGNPSVHEVFYERISGKN